MNRTYWYLAQTDLIELISKLNGAAQKTKIHIINVFHDGVQYIAIYEVDS